MLTFDPAERITAEETLDSPYFKMYSCFMDEPIAKQPFHIESEVDDLPPITIKKLILEECRDRTDIETLFSMENVSVFEGDEENVSYDSLFTKTGPEEGSAEKDDGLADMCIDNAFVKRVDSCGNKQSESSEKSENGESEKSDDEESEKSDDEEKEGKAEEFKDAVYRKSLNNLDEIQETGEAVEKGSVESDNEGNEKSETDTVHEKSNKQEEDDKGLKVKSGGCNKTDNKDEKKVEEGAMSKSQLKVSIDSMDDTFEKAFGDKLQKEKLNEQLSNRECENVSVRKKLSNENKELDVHDAEDTLKEDNLIDTLKDILKEDTIKDTLKDTLKEDTLKDTVKEDILKEDTVKEDILKEELKAKEKTLEDCLELGSLRLSQEKLTHSNVQSLPNKCEHDQEETKAGQDFKDKSLFVEQMVDNVSKCNDNTMNTQGTMCNTHTDRMQDLPKKPDLKEVLYVDIPKAASTTSPRGSPKGLGKEASRRTSPTSRERSVRPKKKDWYYTKH